MDDVIELVVILACALGLFGLLLVGIGYPMFRIARYQCEQIAAISGHATRYGWLQGCFVQVGEEFVPLGNWRVIDRE